MHLTHASGELSARDVTMVETDKRVVRWIAQAAVNVELFTIPLYMTTLYSIEGFHPITGKGNDFYKGRIWPGAKAAAFTDTPKDKPGWGNKQAFNVIFSIFIQEMLHLQMAANIATAIGHTPSFTDSALQDRNNGWTCYGPDLTAIPTIVDLRDTSTYAGVKVDVGPLDEDRIALFLAIEQPQDDAERDIIHNEGRYFPEVPFDGGIVTWDKAGKAGNWTAADLTTHDFDPDNNPYDLPAPEQIATALNNLYAPDVREQSHQTLSQAVVGAIKGVTTVLDQYWNPKGASVSFPYPSMAGSGDRMATAWAAMGRTPDLSQGVPAPNTRIVNHTCQGLDLNASGGIGTNACALTQVYHTCRGSNLCKGMGGCGFVQPAGGGGGGCSSSLRAAAPPEPTPGKPQGGGCSAVAVRAKGGLCGTPTPTPTATHFTAPSDNQCGGFGGCAVPISACQIYPVSGTMDLYMLAAAKPTKFGTLPFNKGDKVEDIAFKAFTAVAEKMGRDKPVYQAPNDIRLAFPPST